VSTNLTELAEPATKKSIAQAAAWIKWVAFVATSLLGVCILFLLCEGLASTVFVIQDYVLRWTRVVDMAHSTQFDAELGWVNIPNFYSKDFYDPGVYIQTNSRGFRNREEFLPQVPATKLRVTCVGDSMTFGVGVDNDHAWCEQLSSFDHRMQTVNMGVPGYGLDQTYLLQLREGSRLEYDVRLVAVITDDFRRMTQSNLLGYGKPMLQLRGDELVETHVPIRKSSIFTRWTPWIAKLRSMSIMQKVVWRLQPAPHAPSFLPSVATHNVQQITAKILENLQTADRRKNRIAVVLFLPTLDELIGTGPPATWHDFLRDESTKRGITFIDLLNDAKTLPVSEAGKLFISDGAQRYSDTVGHLSDYGNEYVSRRVYKALTANPEVAAKLSRLR
jgi:hypothetical protein